MHKKSKKCEKLKGRGESMDLAKLLVDKSIEAFIVGVELYNKPTIKYRVEGFSFFICNAWELMLKAYLLKTKGNSSIYYKDNPKRTITLENCIKEIFTNKKDPLRIKYPEELSNKIFSLKKEIDSMEANPSFAISITHYHYLTKDKNKADSFIAIDQKAENNVKIIKEVKNVNNTHPYTVKTALEKINNSLSVKLTSYHFLLFVDYYELKYQERFCFKLENDSQPRYYYSQQAIEFIVEEYSKDPKNIIENLKKKVKKIKKD